MKVSLLLPVASAVLTAALLVIPDGQTTNQIILDGSHRQAPIASDDKAKPVDAEKPLVGDGDAGSQAPDSNQCRTGWAEHYDGLHPEYVLRWDLHQEDHFEDGQININTFEGFHPGAWHAQRYHRRLPPRYFHHKYHHPGGYQGYHESPPLPPVGHRDEVIWSVHRHPAGPGGDEGPEWPPKPPGDMLWPTSRPRMPTGRPTGVPPGVPTAVPPGVPTAVPPGVPTALPTGVPGDDPHWPPKPPSWPPKPPGDPGDRPHWPPKPPGHPGDPPPHHPPSPPHHPPPPPHHPPPHHGPPYHPPPHHFKPHRHNETIWQLISKANITSSFAKAVSHFDDLVAILNSTTANHTVFVPTNCAFERLKKFLGDKKIPREAKKKAITYHILNEPYPMFRLLFAHTAPSSLISDDLGGAQRLRFGLGHHGFAVNFYSHIRAANIFASNGIIHGVDSILIPPPSIPRILRLFPAQFSTWYLAVYLSNITHEVPLGHTGATLFAPPNSAWERLPPRVSSFLFSPWGRKYLKALVKYHIVLNETLYSDAYYHSTSSSGEEEAKTFPRRHFHVDLPTLLDGKHLSIDIGHLGPIINIVINGQSTVKVQDGLAKDGVIQVVSNLLIPPRKPPPGVDEAEHWDTSDMEIKAGLREMTLEEFKDRFEGLLEADDEEVDGEYKEEAGGNIISLWDY